MQKIIKPFTPEIQKKILENQNFRAKIAKESHYNFFHIYFSHYITYETAPFQQDFFSLTENESIKNLVIIAFRGSGKSTIINLSYVLWSILGRQQKKFVLLVGQTQHQARQHLKNIRRELEANEVLRKDLGPFDEEGDEMNAYSLYFKDHNARIFAISMEQNVRGIRHHQYRPDLIICDDIEDRATVKTREGRDKTYDWLTSEVIPMGDKDTRLIMIGNLLHEDSVIMRIRKKIQKKEMNGVYKAYPIVKNKKPLWLSKYPHMKAIKEEEKRIGNYISWMREYKLQIVPDDGQIVLPEDIHYYDELPIENHNEEIREGIYFLFAAIGTDLAISEKQSADYTAFVAVKVFQIGAKIIIYILSQPVNERMHFSGTKERLKALAQTICEHPHQVRLYVEDVGYQKAFEQEMKNDGYHAKGIKIVGDKRSRLCTTHHYIKTGHVLFPRKGCEQLTQQIMGFLTEKNDDLVDALTIAVNEIMKNGAYDYDEPYVEDEDSVRDRFRIDLDYETIRMDAVF